LIWAYSSTVSLLGRSSSRVADPRCYDQSTFDGAPQRLPQRPRQRRIGGDRHLAQCVGLHGAIRRQHHPPPTPLPDRLWHSYRDCVRHYAASHRRPRRSPRRWSHLPTWDADVAGASKTRSHTLRCQIVGCAASPMCENAMLMCPSPSVGRMGVRANLGGNEVK